MVMLRQDNSRLRYYKNEFEINKISQEKEKYDGLTLLLVHIIGVYR